MPTTKSTGKDVKIAKITTKKNDILAAQGTVDVPPPPNYPDKGKDKSLHDIQQASRVERLMLRGVRNDQMIMATLELSSMSALKKYKTMVYARWELTGSENDIRRHRGEAVSRLDSISEKVWDTIDNSEDSKEVQMAIKNLITIEQTRNGLLGLNQRAIERLSETVTDVKIAFTDRTEKHQAMAQIINRAIEMMETEENEKDGKTINHQS